MPDDILSSMTITATALSALPDKTARVVKNAGPWDGLKEPDLIYAGYVDKGRTQSTLGLKSKNEFVKSGWISQDHPFAEAAPNRGV